MVISPAAFSSLWDEGENYSRGTRRTNKSFTSDAQLHPLHVIFAIVVQSKKKRKKKKIPISVDIHYMCKMHGQIWRPALIHLQKQIIPVPARHE